MTQNVQPPDDGGAKLVRYREHNPTWERAKHGVYWEAAPGHNIVSDMPVVLELRRLDGTVMMSLSIHPQQLGGAIHGFGAW